MHRVQPGTALRLFLGMILPQSSHLIDDGPVFRFARILDTLASSSFANESSALSI
jgi:hypothetical protein